MTERVGIDIRIQAKDFDAGVEINRLRLANSSVGAVASFVGVMRDINEGDGIQAMTLEHYPGMTEKTIQDIADQACQRWHLQGVTVIHRVGQLRPQDQIVFVGVASHHRGESFNACEFIMDFLKTRAPFWKKEKTEQGERWVEARDSDKQATKRW